MDLGSWERAIGPYHTRSHADMRRSHGIYEIGSKWPQEIGKLAVIPFRAVMACGSILLMHGSERETIDYGPPKPTESSWHLPRIPTFSPKRSHAEFVGHAGASWKDQDTAVRAIDS